LIHEPVEFWSAPGIILFTGLPIDSTSRCAPAALSIALLTSRFFGKPVE
jgi:hypothetical protein